MPKTGGRHQQTDPFNLHRFLTAQHRIYDSALAELKRGRKRTHWMWFIFPQIDGLGYSANSKFYAIKSAEEARQYLEHPLLGRRLEECAAAVLAASGQSASGIFGFPDELKLKSSMTLFAAVAGAESVFARVLDACFGGQRDSKTLRLLERG